MFVGDAGSQRLRTASARRPRAPQPRRRKVTASLAAVARKPARMRWRQPGARARARRRGAAQEAAGGGPHFGPRAAPCVAHVGRVLAARAPSQRRGARPARDDARERELRDWEGIADSDDDSDDAARTPPPPAPPPRATGFDDDDGDSGTAAACAAAAPAPAESSQDRRLQRVERLGEEILTEQQQIVDFDRRRNANREALAALRRHRSAGRRGGGVGKALGVHRRLLREARCTLDARDAGGRPARLDREIDALRRGITAAASCAPSTERRRRLEHPRGAWPVRDDGRAQI